MQGGSVPVATAASPASALIADELRKLAQLHSEGVLSDAELSAQKARLLA
jgi:hypothetical protein